MLMRGAERSYRKTASRLACNLDLLKQRLLEINRFVHVNALVPG